MFAITSSVLLVSVCCSAQKCYVLNGVIVFRDGFQYTELELFSVPSSIMLGPCSTCNCGGGCGEQSLQGSAARPNTETSYKWRTHTQPLPWGTGPKFFSLQMYMLQAILVTRTAADCLIFTAKCKARYCHRMSSVCPSVRPSLCDVGELWSHRLEFFENNFTVS